MVRDDLIQLLAWRLGDRTDVAERAMLEMEFVQRHVLEEHEWLPWFLETEFASASLTEGDRRVALPEDFLAEIEGKPLFFVEDSGKVTALAKGDYDKLLAKYPGQGQPKAYCMTGDYVQFFPVPDAAYSVGFPYFGRDISMIEANAETKWLKYAAPVVLAAVGAVLAGKHFKDAAAEASFNTDLVQAWQTLYNKHVAQEEVNRARALGAD